MGFHILDKDGLIIGYVETEAEATALLENLPDDIYTFFLGGLPGDVDRFMLQLNGGLGLSPTFFEMLEGKYGRVPESINPFEELKDEYLRNNVFFIKLRYDMINTRLAAQLLSVLRKTLPAGGTFFVIIEKREIAEGLSCNPCWADDVIPFYAPDTDPSDGQSGYGETVLTSTVL